MNSKSINFNKIIGLSLLAMFGNAAAANNNLPEFYIDNQSLSAFSPFSPDVDVFSLGGLEDLISTSYTASFESISGGAIGFFTVLTMDTPFSPLTPSMALSGNFFGGGTSSASFDFMTTPNKYHVAVVSGFNGSSAINTSSHISGSISNGTTYNLQIVPIPETEVWGMMLAGLALLGVTTRHRRNLILGRLIGSS